MCPYDRIAIRNAILIPKGLSRFPKVDAHKFRKHGLARRTDETPALCQANAASEWLLSLPWYSSWAFFSRTLSASGRSPSSSSWAKTQVPASISAVLRACQSVQPEAIYATQKGRPLCGGSVGLTGLTTVFLISLW